jgi:Glycosyl transferase family 11
MSTEILCSHVYGGLGNQLFIVATAMEYATKHKKILAFVYSDRSRENHFGFPTGHPTGITWGTQYKEPRFSFCEIPYFPGNVLMSGYFQSSKYFSRTVIDNICIPKTPAYIFPTIPTGKTPVCIHIRRGDYVVQENFHPTQSPEYYTEAVAVMRGKVPDPHFLIFSDDIAYASTTPIGDIADSEKTIVDLCDKDSINVMKECKHFIIANSTFSWWGAVMGGYEVVVAPKKWFGKSGPQDWTDIYESDWIVI